MRALCATLLSFCCAVAVSAQDLIAAWGESEPGPVQSATRHERTPELRWDKPPRQAMGVQRGFSRHSLGLYVAYGIADSSGDFTCNMADFELEYGYYLHPRHALTLSLNVGVGDKQNNRWIVDEDGASRAYSDNFSRNMVGLMFGYRYTQPLSRSVRLQLGAKAGVDMQGLHADVGRDWHVDLEYDEVWDSDTESYIKRRRRYGKSSLAWGWAYAAHATLEWQVSDVTTLSVGYMYRGTTAAPHSKPDYPQDAQMIRADACGWHELRLGVSRRF